MARVGEVVVKLQMDQIRWHGELWSVRLMVLVTTRPNHVVAVVQGVDERGARCFRLYDNDGLERQRGCGEGW